MLYAGFFTEFFTKSHALLCTRAHQFQAALRGTHQGHRILEPAWAEAALGNFKATALAFDHIGHRNAHILQQEFRFATGRMQVVKYT